MSVTDRLAKRAYDRIIDVNSLVVGVESYRSHITDIYKLLQSEKYYSVGVRNLCFACESVPDDKFSIELLKQCIRSSRIFLYEEMLKSRGIEIDTDDSLFEYSQKAFYSLESDLILTKEQKELYDSFMALRRLVVSAPTSFGKSRIIREIISHSDYRNVVVVVPTNALLSETYFSLRMDVRLSQYSLVFSTHVEPPIGRTIYIFTPEKFDVYTDEHSLDYDFFVFDEVYKVDSTDNRSSVFSSCLYKAYVKKCDYYFIGPYFRSFSKTYLEKTNGHFRRFETDIVQKQIINYLPNSEINIGGISLPSRAGKDVRLKQVVSKIEGQTIVYVCRKDSAETRAKTLAESRSETVNSNELDELINYIKKHISTKWRLVEYLLKGVAFHHAGIPKYIQTEIVDLFNDGVLDIIVCTPTLTEGVNTTAKNVVFYDTTKADIELTGFEVKNIVGRSGRFGQHFVGRAVFLDSHTDQDDIDEISFPIFDYEVIPKEDNIQISLDDLNSNGKEQRAEIVRSCVQNNVPIDVLKKNKYVPFENQLSLILILRSSPDIRNRLKYSGNLPSKEQVDMIMYLVHEILFSKNEKKDSWSTERLSKFVKYQLYYNPSLKELISEYTAAKEDTKIRNILELVYRYFEFSLPKYILALENIFNFVYSEKLSLSLMVTHLQYGSNELQDILLSDAGLPKSLIQHLSNNLKGVKSMDDIKKKIDNNPGMLRGLSNIEMKMLSKRV